MMAEKARLFGDEVAESQVFATHDPRAARPSEWPGRNLLGFALMGARRTLADGSDTLPG